MTEKLKGKRTVFLGDEQDYFKLITCPECSEVTWFDIEAPYEELIKMADEGMTQYLLVRKSDNYIANRMLWECGSIEGVVLVDSENPFEIEEKRGKMNKPFWEFVQANSHSQIEETGAFHYFNKEPFSEEEMKEFVENVYMKIKGYLDSEKTALEIGCAGGLTMFRLAPHLKTYIGTDMTKMSVRKNSARIEENNINNIQLFQCEANKVKNLPVSGVNIVIINSVIQFFPGINYLKDVLEQCCGLMNDEGIIFLGDIIDLGKKKELLQEYLALKCEHAEAAVWTDFANELFLSRDCFKYLSSQIDGLSDIEITDKTGEIRNELTEYRYDVMIHYKKEKKRTENHTGKNQYAWKLI